MEPMQNGSRTPFADLTSNNAAAQTISNSQVDEGAQRKRERENARYANMTQEERDEKNKKRREKYHTRKAVVAKTAGSTVEVDSRTENFDAYEGTDWLHRNNSFSPMWIDKENICIDQSGIIDLTDASPHLNSGAVNASNSIDNSLTSQKEHKRELDRARRGAMSPEQKALMNKRRRELYAAKKAQKPDGKKLHMTTPEKMTRRKESQKNYKMMVKEHRANSLHPDSIAMESPSFTPKLIFPSSPHSPKATSRDMEIPELTGTPVYIVPAVVQDLEVQTPESSVAHRLHSQRVPAGERNAWMSQRNQDFEANIGRRALGSTHGKCNDVNNPTQSSVVHNKVVL